MPKKTPPRKRGAQPKNINSLRHGIYSKFVTVADVSAMQGMSDHSLEDDLALARVQLVNAIDHRQDAEDSKTKLSWDLAAHYWLELIITAKLRNRDIEQAAGVVWTSLIEAVRAANDKQVTK